MSNKLKSYKLQAEKNGFTLIELLVSMGIFAIVLAGSWVSYLNFQNSHSLDSYTTQAVSLINQAQGQAMARMCTQGCDTRETGENFGVYFDTLNNKLVLHRGLSYNPGDEYNIDVNLASNITLSENIQNSDLIFEISSGEVRSFNASENTFTLTENNTGENVNFTINGLGTVDIN